MTRTFRTAPAMRALLLASVLLAGAAATASAAPAAPWRASASASVQSGDFGTGLNTTTWYLIFGLRRLFDAGDVGVSVPLIRATSETATDSTTTMGPGGRSSTNEVTESGLGDVRVNGRWYAYDTPDWRTSLAVFGEVKFPTGDENKGLGTGTTDKTLGLEFTRFLTARTFAFVDPAYTFMGQDTVDYRDQWRITLGGGRYVGESLVFSIAYERRRALLAGEDDPEEVLAGISGTNGLGWQVAANAGLSDGAPDYGLSVGVYRRF